MEGQEKIYCFDKGNDLATAMLAKGNDMSPFAYAAMNGGMGNQWNNPFIYLVWMMFAGRFFNNGDWGNGQNAQNIEVQNQLAAIRSQLSDNQNSGLLMDAIKGNNVAISQLASNLNCDFNSLNQSICCVKSAIDTVAGQVGLTSERVINAVNSGSCSVIQAIKDCCCNTQKSILEMGYQNQLQNCNQTNTIMQGINTVNTGVERAASNLAYATQQQTCDLLNAGKDNTQRIIDTLNGHWQNECSQKLQDAKFEISQLRQNQYLTGVINGCGCGCGSYGV